jgi:cutinase
VIGRRVAVALLLVLGACGSAPGTSTSSKHSASSTTSPARHQALLVTKQCADLVVLGARGSSQSASLNRGVGAEVRLSVEATARRLHQRSNATVRIEAVRYDASGGAAYQAQVGAGAQLMQRQLTTDAGRCPHSRFALVGFSEGAQVVHAAAIDVPKAVEKRVALIAMIADPRRNPGDAIAHWSYGEPAPRPGRLGAGTPIDPQVRGATITLCAPGDEICNGRGSPGASPSATHRHFYERPSSTRSTSQQLDRILRSNGV